MTLPETPRHPDSGAPGGWLGLVAVLTALVLGLTLDSQIYDTNFYSLWEATALLAGDHPYRDFYEWGVPLQASVSAIAQWLVGYRLIGEFLVQWSFIIAGAMISFDVGFRLSRSLRASVAMALLALAILPDTPTFHYPKLFLYPLAICLGWRYMERPGAVRAAVLGLATAVAFLFRHDHGVYVGGAAVLAFLLARAAVPSSRQWRSMIRETAAYAVTAGAILVPWMVLVHLNEGLPEYVRARADLYQMWSASSSPYRSLLSMNPIRFLRGESPPAPKPAPISVTWEPTVTAAQRKELEQQHGMRLLEGPDDNGRWRYEIQNVYDPALLRLSGVADQTEGIDWGRVQALNSWLPLLGPTRVWLAQVTMLVPVLLLAAAGLGLLRSWRLGTHVPVDTYPIVLAATFLAVIDARLLREPSYAHLVAPITAALSTRLLSRKTPTIDEQTPAWARIVRLGAWIRIATVVGVTLVTGIAALACLRSTSFPRPTSVQEFKNAVTGVHRGFARSLVSPPIDGFVTMEHATEYDAEAWAWPDVLLRYLHDCTHAGDRVLVTGSTPYHIGYLIERPIAGGQLFWHHRWRADPVREAQSLTLLQSQSVPFAFSTHDPVLDDLKTYPRIRTHIMAHYTELQGSHGLLLVDNRRQPTGQFGRLGFPCFK
jgi:4-amino-4-deoxy-L-arabinose transferase-like glycosyltransferase